jgi:hypothetical protein
MNAATEIDGAERFVARPSDTSDPIVVARLYNRNGMASWCWEAAHAIRCQGRNVLLIADPDTPLPGSPEVEVVRIDLAGSSVPRSSGMARAFATAAGSLSSGQDGVLERIHLNLLARGVQPAAYILNQSTLVDPGVPCAQLVAAWSYPVDLLAYLRKIPVLVPDLGPKALLRTALSLIGWWRKDWRAYRSASRVLPVTGALLKSLRRRSVLCDLAYPGTSIGRPEDRDPGGTRLLMAAANLGESRKRILWMLEAMTELKPPAGTVLQLAGEPDDSIRRAAARIGFPVEFLGHLERRDLQDVMRKAHIFCFGSILDDWGYVLVEAMANGLVPIAPGLSPFNEILGETGACYNPHSQQNFVQVLRAIISGDLVLSGRLAWDRAQALFSREAFGRSILASLQSVPGFTDAGKTSGVRL